jgi:hypothetical protein
MTVPQPVRTYLTTPKAELGPRLAELFTEDGRTHVGLDAIREWTDAVAAAFTFTRTVTDTTTAGNAVVVRTRVAGDFPGSPVDLHHHFSLDGDRISALTTCP